MSKNRQNTIILRKKYCILAIIARFYDFICCKLTSSLIKYCIMQDYASATNKLYDLCLILLLLSFVKIQ